MEGRIERVLDEIGLIGMRGDDEPRPHAPFEFVAKLGMSDRPR
jgi:hypothetical protein